MLVKWVFIPTQSIDLFNQIYWLQLAQEGQLKRGAGDYDQEAPANKRSFDNQQQDMNDMSAMGLVSFDYFDLL